MKSKWLTIVVKTVCLQFAEWVSFCFFWQFPIQIFYAKNDKGFEVNNDLGGTKDDENKEHCFDLSDVLWRHNYLLTA